MNNELPPLNSDDEFTKKASRRIIAGIAAGSTVAALGIGIGIGQSVQRDNNEKIAQDVHASKVYESNLSDNQIIFATNTADQQLKPNGTHESSDPEILGSFTVGKGGNILSSMPTIDNSTSRISPDNINFSTYTTQFSASVAQGKDGVVQPGETFNVVAEDVNGDGKPEIIVKPAALNESVADKVAASQKIAYEQEKDRTN